MKRFARSLVRSVNGKKLELCREKSASPIPRRHLFSSSQSSFYSEFQSTSSNFSPFKSSSNYALQSEKWNPCGGSLLLASLAQHFF